MALTFADTHNMIAYVNKSDASEGFEQILDFLNASVIHIDCLPNEEIFIELARMGYEKPSTKLTYLKKVNDVTRLQALVDKKKLIITEATIREVLRLDDAKSIDCLPNEEIFTELSRMGTSWNEFSSSMASAVMCLSSGMIVAQQADDVADEGAVGVDVDVDVVPTAIDEPFIPSPTPTTQPPPPSQELPFTSQIILTPPPSLIDIVCQALYLDDAESIDCLPNEEIFIELARMGDVGLQQAQDDDIINVATNDVANEIDDVVAEPTQPSPTLAITPPPPQELPSTSQVAPTPPPLPIAQPSSPPQQQQPSQPSQTTEISMDLLNTLGCIQIGGIIAEIDVDEDVILEKVDAKKDAKVAEKDAADDEPKPAELKEVIEVVTTAKLITEVVTTTTTITAAPITTATILAAPGAARKRKGVVIRDPEKTATPSTIVHFEPKSKDKGKGILVEEPKPLKKQAQIEQDKAYARELEAELHKNIN
nr:hypothetical protein [Tanacetum cinerariifolium]